MIIKEDLADILDWFKGVIYLWLNMFIVFFSPIVWVALLVGIATIVDMVFGIWKNIKLGHKINSKKMRSGFLSKTFVYVGLVLFVFAIDHLLLNQIFELFINSKYLPTKLFALILIGIEVYSMDESYKEIKGKSFLNVMFLTIKKMNNARKKLENKIK